MRGLYTPIVVLLTVLGGTSCTRWHEFHSVQPYAGAKHAVSVPTDLGTSRPFVVVLAGSEGTEVFDLLAPYAILSLTKMLDVVVAARDTATVPLWRGLALRPHHTLAEVDAAPQRPVAVVVPNFADAREPEIDEWLGRYARDGGVILSVCEGSRVLARAGILEGRRATSHSEALRGLSRAYPTVHWQRGPRWVVDGPIITSAGVSASVEGALALVERLVGADVRDRVMREIAYPDSVPLAQFGAAGIPRADKFHLARRALFGGIGHVVLPVDDGVDELRLAASLDAWARAFPRTLRTVSRDDGWVTTRHGLVIGPTAPLYRIRDANELVMVDARQGMKPAVPSHTRVTVLPDGYPFAVLAASMSARIGERSTRAIFRTMDLPWTSEN